MKTAEVLDQTETFETAGFDILNHVGKITQVDMPMEYGRVCLAEQVGKHAALFLDFTQELDTVEEFILWINENQCHLVKLIGSLRGKPLTKIYKL